MNEKSKTKALNELIEVLKHLPYEKIKGLLAVEDPKVKAHIANRRLRARAMNTFISKMVH